MLEQSTRSAAIYHDYLREHRPDVVVLTPMVVLKTAQLDLARAALELGIRNVFAVASWDHLSSKGELNFSPQQRDRLERGAEAGGDRAARISSTACIVVTGSQVFDDWFDTTTVDDARGVLRARRPAARSPDRALRLLVAARRQPAGADVRRASG